MLTLIFAGTRSVLSLVLSESKLCILSQKQTLCALNWREGSRQTLLNVAWRIMQTLSARVTRGKSLLGMKYTLLTAAVTANRFELERYYITHLLPAALDRLYLASKSSVSTPECSSCIPHSIPLFSLSFPPFWRWSKVLGFSLMLIINQQEKSQKSPFCSHWAIKPRRHVQYLMPFSSKQRGMCFVCIPMCVVTWLYSR